MAKLEELFPHSDSVLHARHAQLGIRHWFAKNRKSAVLYQPVRGARVTLGGHLGTSEIEQETLQEFSAEAKRFNDRVVLFGTTKIPKGWNGMRVAHEPRWDLSQWPAVIAHSRNLQKQLARARAKGLVMERSDASIHTELLDRWKATRKMNTLGFAAQPGAGNTYFQAKRNNASVASTSVTTWNQRWHIEDIARGADTTNGTVEALVTQVANEAIDRKVTTLSMGMVPLYNSQTSSLAVSRKLGSIFYNFNGLKSFRQKFRPTHWQELYIAWPTKQRGGAQLAFFDLLSAFAHGKPLRFATSSLLRRVTF